MNEGNYAPQHNGGGGGLLWLLLLLGVFFGVMLAGGGARGGTQETLSGNLAENQLMSGNRADLAEADFGDIPLWTRSRFGDWAARHFARTLALKSREQSVGTRSRAAFARCLWPGQGAADDTSSSSGLRARPRTG